MLPHSLLVRLPHCVFSPSVLGEGRMISGTLCSMCVCWTLFSTLLVLFLMNYAYVCTNVDAKKKYA